MVSPVTVDHGRSFTGALQRLNQAQKPGPGVPAYTRWVNRRLGRVLAAGAYSLGLSPNQVTGISGAVSLLAIAMLAFVPITLPWMALVAALLLLAYALDSADGQVARLRGVSSKAGEWLDHVVDAARLPAFHMGVAAALWRAVPDDIRFVAVVPLLFALLASTWFFAQILAAQMLSRRDLDVAPEGSAAPNWVSFAKLPSDIGSLYLLLLLMPWPTLFLPLYGGLFAFSLVMATLALRRRFRELAAVG